MTRAKMKKSPAAQLEPPRFEDTETLLIAGFRSHYISDTMDQIPSLWQRFGAHIGSVPGQIGRKTYGLCWTHGKEPGIDYLVGVEVSSSSGLPKEFTTATIPAQRCAVFQHRGHVSKLYETCEAISEWFPESGYQGARGAADAPDFFERYTEEFNPQTGLGGIEVWVPIKS